METFTLEADAIIRQARRPESGPWMLRRFVWAAIQFDILRLRGTRLEQIYEAWLEVSEPKRQHGWPETFTHRPDDCVHHICRMIHILRNTDTEALTIPETKAERRERSKWNRKKRKGGER